MTFPAYIVHIICARTRIAGVIRSLLLKDEVLRKAQRIHFGLFKRAPEILTSRLPACRHQWIGLNFFFPHERSLAAFLEKGLKDVSRTKP